MTNKNEEMHQKIADDAEIFHHFQNLDMTQTPGELLENILHLPGIIVRLSDRSPNWTGLNVIQKGIFSFKNGVLKNWKIGVLPSENNNDLNQVSLSSQVIEVNQSMSNSLTISIDPRDIEDARWSGKKKSTLGFIVMATVSNGYGVHRGFTKINFTNPNI